jgi:hypothetical protein
MKKILLLIGGLFILLLVAAYFFIPGTLTVSETLRVNCVSEAAFRSLSNQPKWSPFGEPGSNSNDSSAISYTITKKANNSFEIQVTQDSKTHTSQMNFISLMNDSSMIIWQCKVQTSRNPFKRLSDYVNVLSLKKSMDNITAGLQLHLSNIEDVYGFAFKETSTTDTLYISTKSLSARYPGNEIIYSLVNKLKKFCTEEGCSVTNSPMLNISKSGPDQYQVMIALPVNKVMQPKDSVFPGRMVPGKFISAEVRGGFNTVEYALSQAQFYFQDYKRSSMAIPFQYLITDRQKETDSTKWITKIYVPVY